MQERRKHNRLYLDKGEKIELSGRDLKVDVKVLDVSAGGMRISFSQPMEIGEILFGKFEFLSDSGPFFVKGKVVRNFEKNGEWELGIQFDKVRTTSMEALFEDVN